MNPLSSTALSGTILFPTMRSQSVLFAVLLALPACGGSEDTTTQVSGLCGAELGPAPLRRITRFEYGRTLADLTGVPPTIADLLRAN